MPAGRRLSDHHAGVAGGDRRAGLAPLACPAPHGSITAGVTEADEFTPGQRGVAAALRPALLEVAETGDEDTHTWRLAPERGTTGLEPAPDRLALRAKLGGHARDGDAGRMQPRGSFAARLPPGMRGLAAPGGRGRLDAVRRRRGHRRDGALRADLLGGTPDHRMLTVDHGADGITEVARACASGLSPGPHPARPGACRPHRRRPALPRQVAQEPPVAAVDAARNRSAVGTRGRCGLQLGDGGGRPGGGQAWCRDRLGDTALPAAPSNSTPAGSENVNTGPLRHPLSNLCAATVQWDRTPCPGASVRRAPGEPRHALIDTRTEQRTVSCSDKDRAALRPLGTALVRRR